MEEPGWQVHRIRILRGLTRPYEEFKGIKEADQIKGSGWRLVVLSILSAIFAGLFFYIVQALGLEPEVNQSFTINSSQMSESNVPLGKNIVLVGGIFGGLVGPVITMVVGALIFLIFFSDIGFMKLFAIELYLQFIGLINTIVGLILIFVFQTYSKSFLNLGAITELFTENIFINTFFSGITIFLIWKLYVQIRAYRHASEKSSSYVVWTPILLNLLLLLAVAGFSVIGQQLVEQFQQMQ
ncbi:MAG TPA: YIP1 family protein [Bacillales bacterium]|nr:YIP1 family protein [Bacillales bacterium]